MVDGVDGAQPLGGFLGGQVALGLGEQLVADHELADAGRPQERRVEVGVELPVARSSAASPSNGAWCQPIEYGNGLLEQVVVPAQEPTQRSRARPSRAASSRSGSRDGGRVAITQRLERPGRPERDDDEPVGVLARRPAGRRVSWSA